MSSHGTEMDKIIPLKQSFTERNEFCRVVIGIVPIKRTSQSRCVKYNYDSNDILINLLHLKKI